MAKAIAVRLGGESSSFSFSRLDREKLYGRKERQVIDGDGHRCSSAWLSSDGAALVPSGGLTMLYVDDAFLTLERSSLKAVDQAGVDLPLQPCTLGVEQELVPVEARQVLDHAIHAVYQLQPETLGPDLDAHLKAGKIFRAPFNYRDDYALETMFVLGNEAGLFALVGTPHGFGLIHRDVAPVVPAADEQDDLSDDLDFNML
jgi:hypothetical protein